MEGTINPNNNQPKSEDKIDAKESKENILEVGEYQINGPESGDIMIDKITLMSTSGAKRIWKVRSITQKEVIFDVIKFG